MSGDNDDDGTCDPVKRKKYSASIGAGVPPPRNLPEKERGEGTPAPQYILDAALAEYNTANH